MLLVVLKDGFIFYSKLVWKICLAKWTLYTELVKSPLLTQIKDNIGWQHVKQHWQDSQVGSKEMHIFLPSWEGVGKRSRWVNATKNTSSEDLQAISMEHKQFHFWLAKSWQKSWLFPGSQESCWVESVAGWKGCSAKSSYLCCTGWKDYS